MNQIEIKQKIDKQIIVFNNLPNILEQNLGISANDFLLMAALVGRLYDFKHIKYIPSSQLNQIQESPTRQSSSPSRSSKSSFVQIKKILQDNNSLHLLIDLLQCDLESDPGEKSVQEYHMIIDDIIKLLGGESDGRVHTLYAIADIARGKIDKQLFDQKLLSLKSQNSIDFLVFFTGLASLSSVIQPLPQNEQKILAQKIESTISGPSAEAIFKVLRVRSQVVQQLLKLIFIPNKVDVRRMMIDFNLERAFQRNRQLLNFIEIMLQPIVNQQHDGLSPVHRYSHRINRQHNIGQSLMSRNHHSILQLALNLHSGNIEALSQYQHLQKHLQIRSRKRTEHVSILKSLLSMINPKCTVPLYDNFRVLMVELGNQKGANAIKLANLDPTMLNQIQQSSGILKQALASVLIAIQQFPGNLKSGWYERAVLKRLRGQDSYKLRISYQDDEYLEQANILQNNFVQQDDEQEDEDGQNMQRKNFNFLTTEFDFYQTAVFNKLAKYGYDAKVDLLKNEFGYEDEQIRQVLGDDQKSYQQHFTSVWGKDLEPDQLFLREQQALDQKTNQKNAKKKMIDDILKNKKVDLITKKRLNSLSDEVMSEGKNQQEAKNINIQNAGMLKKRWTIQGDRDDVQNIWEGLIVPLTKIGHVQVADILFAWNILALRQIARNPDKVKKDQDAYNHMLQRIDDILHYIELHGLANNVFDQDFDKFKFVKLIAMTLGVKIPALAERWFLSRVASQYKMNIESQNADDLDSSQQPRENYENQGRLLQKSIQDQRITFTWEQIEDFFINQNDKKDLNKLYGFPYQNQYDKHLISAPEDKNKKSFFDKDLEQLLWKRNLQRQDPDKQYRIPKSVQQSQLNDIEYRDLRAYYIALQQVTFIDSEYYEFLMELSEGHIEVWQRNQQLLEANNLIQESDYNVVQAITQLINIRKTFQTYLKSRFGKMEQDQQDWQVPRDEIQDQDQKNNLSEREAQQEEQQKQCQPRQEEKNQTMKKYQLQFIKHTLEQLFSSYNQPIDLNTLSELVAFSLCSPNTDDYQTIYQKLQQKSQISGLLQTSSFAHARVIIPGFPIYWTQDQIVTHDNEMNYMKNYIQQLAEFSQNISRDQQSPFDPHVVAGLAFLSYNKRLALQLLFTDAFKQKNERHDDDVLQQQQQQLEDNGIKRNRNDSLANGPIFLDKLFNQCKFRGNSDNNPLLSAAAAQRVLDSNLSFIVNQKQQDGYDYSKFIASNFSKEFIIELPSMLKSLDQQDNDKLLIISHILIGLISGVALNCYEDAVTALRFLQQNADQQLYTYIQHLIFQKFEIQIVKDQMRQLENLQGSQLQGSSSIGNQQQRFRPIKQIDRRNFGQMQQSHEEGPPPRYLHHQMEGEDEHEQSLDQFGLTNKAAAQKIPGIKLVKKKPQDARQEISVEQLKEEEEQSQMQLSDGDMTINSHEQETSLQQLQQFKCHQVLSQSSDGYRMSVYGTVKGVNALLKISRAPIIMEQVIDLENKEEVKLQERQNKVDNPLFQSDNDIEESEDKKSQSNTEDSLVLQSRPRLKYKRAKCYFINAQFRRFKLVPAQQTNQKTIECELVLPADKTLIQKQKERKAIVIDQSKRIYLTKTLRIIQDEPKEKLQWIRNIFNGLHTQERIIIDKKDEENGYIVIEDYDYNFNMPDYKFHALAIPTNHRLRTIRDLNKDHVPMLRNIMSQTVQVIKNNYGIMPYQLVIYFHYPPTFNWLHIHFSSAEDMSKRTSIGRAIMLRDVIQNIELKSNYYEDATLAIRMNEGHRLLEMLKNDEK